MHDPAHRTGHPVRLMNGLRKSLAANMIRDPQQEIGGIDPHTVKVKEPFQNINNGKEGEGGLEPENRSAVFQELRHRPIV